MENEKIIKLFNTTGPVNQPEYYKIDPLTRWDMQEVLSLIQGKRYFILHAPRQTGKTSCLLALQDYLNKEGKYFALYTNIEGGYTTRDDVDGAIKTVVEVIINRLQKFNISQDILDKLTNIANTGNPTVRLTTALSYLSSVTPKPIVLFIDEVDNLMGEGLISVLRQLRSNYDARPTNYPSTVMLCGVRDIQDYRTDMVEMKNRVISAFNISAKSLRLGNFIGEEVKELYLQHTKETGQVFADGCIEKVMEYTDGQPWLVNAIANEVTNEMTENRDRSVVITPAMIEVARERLTISRQTHIKQLEEKLREDRVQRVIMPTLTGEYALDLEYDDVDYCIDLGLVKKVDGIVVIANKIYSDVIPRQLTKLAQEKLPISIPSTWKNTDGSINVNNMLTLYKDYWYQNMAIWGKHMPGYKEACAQLVTLTYLNKIVNGGGTIEREAPVGQKKMDIYIKRNYYVGLAPNKTLKIQKIVLELKTIKDKQNYETEKQKAIEQTAEYAVLIGVKVAYILIFNRGKKKRWTAADENEYAEYNGVKLEIWKM